MGTHDHKVGVYASVELGDAGVVVTDLLQVECDKDFHGAQSGEYGEWPSTVPWW
ncbi:hypothetical protein [Streptomyces sp. NPDC018833]|uniref:hypothetical protein n=1 Tax=Streptomyces sp. NPDC018833 TaxID=3365053 RepID=UPI00378D4D2E